jgi:glyoxylase-like metal-dependent hydrolase (beta-lactamase superfamily II)
MPLRMSVVRLPGGGLVVHSPIAADEALFSAVAKLGRVEHVLAPSRTHHLYVGPWLARFPEARAYAAPGLRDKRRDLPWAGDLDGSAAPWSQALEAISIGGAPKLGEVVFFHRVSKSLIVTDLLFNMIGPTNLPTTLVLLLGGTRGRLAMSRVWRLATRDRAALRASCERVLACDFERILPAHGAIYSAPNARTEARRAMGWALAQPNANVAAVAR